PSMGPFVSSWLLPPGDYDAMAFSGGDADVPFLLVPAVHLAADLELDMGGGFPDRTLEWRILDGTGAAHPPAPLDALLWHSSGAGLGFVGATTVATTRLPMAGPDYRLEWTFYDDTGDVRHDIPGTTRGPFADATVTNDPAALKRSTEHHAVTPGDSLLPL